jgi:hypothetical protein
LLEHLSLQPQELNPASATISAVHSLYIFRTKSAKKEV